MQSVKKRGNKIRILLLLSVFVIGIIGIGIYPFDNRSLQMKIVTTKGTYVQEIGSEDIAGGTCQLVELTGIEDAKIKKVRFYGEMKSILLKEVPYGEFTNYIDRVENGEIIWDDGFVEVTGEKNIRMYMKQDYIQILQKMSASFFQERLILGELWGVIVIMIAVGIMMIQERKTENNWNNHGPIFEIKKFCGDIREYWQYIIYAAKTDLKAEVADSYLNRLWWLLEPFFNMIVYVVVFGNIMGGNVENYATFIFSALLMWNFFSKTINYSVKSVRNNKDIITKVYIPKFVILLSNMVLNLFKLLFSMTVLVVMILIFRVHIGVNLLWFILSYIVMMLLSFGLGMIFMHFGVYVDDLSYAIGILINMLMFLSGIFYDVMTTLPDPLNSLMLCLNPVAMLIDTMRNALLYNTASNLPLVGVWFLISVILCGIGVHIVYKNENSYVKIV